MEENVEIPMTFGEYSQEGREAALADIEEFGIDAVREFANEAKPSRIYPFTMGYCVQVRLSSVSI
jgi:hypothetical protein